MVQVGSVLGSALLSLLLDAADVLLSVLGVSHVRIGLGRTFLVRVAHQVLNAEQNLGDRQGGPPIFVLVQDGEAHCPRWVYVRMEEYRHELAFRRLVWVVLRKFEDQTEHTALPLGFVGSENNSLPSKEGVLIGSGGDARILATLALLLHLFKILK